MDAYNKRLIRCSGILIGVSWILNSPFHWPPFQSVVVGVLAALVVDSRTRKRTRRIRSSVRRAVIERDLITGEDPRDYHLDHRMPFSRGGSNTVDNLRLLPKRENLRKGRRLPRLRDLG